MCTLTQWSLIKAVKYCIVRRAFKTLCQISGEKKYIVLKKRLKLYRLPYRCHSIGMTTKTGWLSANHTLFPSIYCCRKQRIKISRDMKDKIVSDFLFVLVDSRMKYEQFFCAWFPTTWQIQASHSKLLILYFTSPPLWIPHLSFSKCICYRR